MGYIWNINKNIWSFALKIANSQKVMSFFRQLQQNNWQLQQNVQYQSFAVQWPNTSIHAIIAKNCGFFCANWQLQKETRYSIYKAWVWISSNQSWTFNIQNERNGQNGQNCMIYLGQIGEFWTIWYALHIFTIISRPQLEAAAKLFNCTLL